MKIPYKQIIVCICIIFCIHLLYRYYYNIKLQEERKSIRQEFENMIQLINEQKPKTESVKKKITIPVYYINMDKNEDRNNFMIKQLNEYAQTYERIRGFNGYAIQNKHKDTVNGISFENHYTNLTKGEIGCSLSHILAIEKAYQNDNEVALILEDDTVLDLLDIIDFDINDIIVYAPSDWEIIQLFHMHNQSEKVKKLKSLPHPIHKDYQYLLHDKKNYLYSCVGYIINKKGMKKIVDYVHPLENSIYIIGKVNNETTDGTSDTLLYDLTTTYILTPSMVYPNNLSLKSTIHDDHTSEHIKRSLEVVEFYYKKLKIKKVREFSIPILYINLDHRTDRRHYMEKEMDIFLPETVLRISSILDENGQLGCLKSHIKMLTYALEHFPTKDVLFCEDDIEFLVDPRLFLYDIYQLHMDWDVVMLAHNTSISEKTSFPGISRIFDSFTCACYLVRSTYIPILLDIYKQSLMKYEETGSWSVNYASDVCWKQLQKHDRWFTFDTRIAKQRESYSDIEKKMVDYHV